MLCEISESQRYIGREEMKKNKGTEGWQDTGSSEGEVLEGARRYTQGTRQGDSTSPEACAKKKRKSATPFKTVGQKADVILFLEQRRQGSG